MVPLRATFNHLPTGSLYDPPCLERVLHPSPLLWTVKPTNQPAPRHMPTRTEASAPQFDQAKPREIPIYFNELDFLFADAHITDDQKKKEHARRYVPCEDYELWGMLPTYQAPATYQEFRTAVLRLYDGVTKEQIEKVDQLVSERLAVGITSVNDLAIYYR